MLKKIIEKKDDNYGMIKYELIANINYNELRKKIEFDVYQKWAKKYHPIKYFNNLLYKEIDSMEKENVNLFVCIDDINKSWDSSFWENKYKEIFNKGKKKEKIKLPIVTTRKKVNKWIEEYEKLLNGINKK